MFVFGLNELGYRAVDQLLKSHPNHTLHHTHVINFFVTLSLCVCASDNGWEEPGKEGSFGNSWSKVCHSIIDHFWQFGRQAAFNACFLRSKHTVKNSIGGQKWFS